MILYLALAIVALVSVALLAGPIIRGLRHDD
jgi:hypothetical protein